MSTVKISSQGISYNVTFPTSKDETINLPNVYSSVEHVEGESIQYAVLSAVTIEEDNFQLIITKDYIDKIKDPFVQTVLRSKPKIVKKLFSGDYKISHKIHHNNLICSIENTDLDVIFKFVLEKEKIDENALLRRQIARLDKRIKELETRVEREESLEYIDMPNWSNIEKDVITLYDRLDPDYKKFKTEQHNTDHEVMIQKFFSVFTSEQKYAAWLSLLFHRDKKMIIGADVSVTVCSQTTMNTMQNAEFIQTNDTPMFRKFFVKFSTVHERSRLIFKVGMTSTCNCATHKYGNMGFTCVSYIDY